MAEVKDKRYDNWSSRIDDRCSVTIRHFDKYKPVGDGGVQSFLTLVSKHAKQDLPSLLDHCHCPTSFHPLNDTRLVFASPYEANYFVKIMSKIDFSSLKIQNISYVDVEASHVNLDNSSIRIIMECHHGVKSTKTIKRNVGEGSAILKPCDPYQNLLSSFGNKEGTPVGEVETPFTSPRKEDEMLMGKRQSSSTLESVMMDDSNGDSTNVKMMKKDQKESVHDVKKTELAVERSGSSSSEKGLSGEKRKTLPASREDALERVNELKEKLKTLLTDASGFSVDKRKTKIDKYQRERKLLMKVLNQFDENEGLLEWTDYIELIE